MTVLLDLRVSEKEHFDVLRRIVTQQCSELLALARIANTPLCVRLGAMYHDHVHILADDVLLNANDASLQQLLRTLETISQLPGESIPGRLGVGSTRALHSFLSAMPTVENNAAKHLILFATSFVPYTELYSSLVNMSCVPVSFTLHCVAMSSEALGVSSLSLGALGQLFHCSVDPVALQAAVQTVLGAYTLPPASQPLPLVLMIGTLAIACEAQRPYLSHMHRCCTINDFPMIQEQRPSLMFQGPLLVHSGFELYHTRPLDPPRLVLEAVLPPGNVEEAYLYDNSWVLRAVSGESSSVATLSPAQLLDALYAEYQEDALILRCAQSALDAPHDMAVQSTVFVAYFADRATLLMRQIIPTERRRLFIEAPLPVRHENTSLATRLRNIRKELLNRDFFVDHTVSCGLIRVASQMTRNGDCHLEVLRGPRRMHL